MNSNRLTSLPSEHPTSNVDDLVTDFMEGDVGEMKEKGKGKETMQEIAEEKQIQDEFLDMSAYFNSSLLAPYSPTLFNNDNTQSFANVDMGLDEAVQTNSAAVDWSYSYPCHFQAHQDINYFNQDAIIPFRNILQPDNSNFASSSKIVNQDARAHNTIDHLSNLVFTDDNMQSIAAFLGLNNNVATSTPATISPSSIRIQQKETVCNDGQHVQEHSRMPVPVMDNRDLNDIAYMNDVADDTSIGDNNEDDEDENTIEVTDIARHFWTNDIQYQVANRGRNFYLTATELQDRFEGVKIALSAYWKEKGKKPGRISYHRVQQYLISFGIQGFFAELMWQFLTDSQHRELRQRRKNGTLSEFAFR